MPEGSDGCIVSRLVFLIRRDGLTQAIEDSAPRDLWRRALRITGTRWTPH